METFSVLFELPSIADKSSVSVRFALEESPPSLTFNKDAIFSTRDISGVIDAAAAAAVDGLFPNIALPLCSSVASRRRSSMERVIK